MVDVSFRAMSKKFGTMEVIPSLDLTLRSGEFTALLGPSGCGKTTLLRMVAGLENPTAGQIQIGDRDVTALRPSARDIAMVFQSYALYPHLSVANNIGFPLRVQGISKADRKLQIERTAETLGLSHLLERRPRELSGGQRQRVALGRAMVRDPSVFLFDEPLSNLDASMREEMRAELIRFHAAQKKTVIYVTHDQVEAMTMAQRIVILKAGRIQQIGTPQEVYRNPANTFVAKFIGSPGMNLLEFAPSSGAPMIGGAQASLIGDGVSVPTGAVTLGCRPEDLNLGEPDGPGYRFEAQVGSIQPLGASVLVDLTTAGGEQRFVALTAWRDEMPQAGSKVTAFAPAGRICFFDESGIAIRA